jgi:PfaB family protein
MQPHDSIAVVGMAGIFPGAADLNQYWHNILNKVDAAREVPPERWTLPAQQVVNLSPAPDKAFNNRACLIEDLGFDPAEFHLDHALLSELDPVHQLVLKAGRQAFKNSPLEALDKGRIGTILAAIVLPTEASSRFSWEILGKAIENRIFKDIKPEAASSYLASSPLLSTRDAWASRAAGTPAAMLAKELGLGGGSYTLDAACASSLYAIKLACDELTAGRLDAVLAGGVSRPDALYTQIGFSQLRALSRSGRCAPFDAQADGLVVGEGCGIVVLRRLADARRDGNKIWCVIRGIGLSNDMGGNLLAPKSEGQLRALHQAYRMAAWSPTDVDLIECHGAGTPVGDNTELLSLCQLWKSLSYQPGQCAIGSVKSMIGHLLTAAGAAGLIKTILAIHHRTLPPSLHFSTPPPNSPLPGSPFRVQTEPAPWKGRASGNSFRAAVSAFGFGGINAHVLIEALPARNKQASNSDHAPLTTAPGSDAKASSRQTRLSSESDIQRQKIPEVAVVGMDAAFGALTSLQALKKAVFKGEPALQNRPAHRWKGSEAILDRYVEDERMPGGYLSDIKIRLGEFSIPPNEIADILPQQLLMLKVAHQALKDADQAARKENPNWGAIIGLDFDFEATNYHLRWKLFSQLKHWQSEMGLSLGSEKFNRCLEELKDNCSPPLTATRTVGALGSIVASRIAKEFRMGGPSFVVSNHAGSGLQALHIALRFLQRHELDGVLIGAVDLAGDPRNFLAAHLIQPFGHKGKVRPFDQSAAGSLTGEGATALVLKRLDQALADGNRIYAVIKGVGYASGGGIDPPNPSGQAYSSSFKRSLEDAGIASGSLFEAIDYVETHGSANTAEDTLETAALRDCFSPHAEGSNHPIAIGSLKPIIGHTGAAAGLAAVVKTCLCLYHQMIPPLPNYTEPRQTLWKRGLFHMPKACQFWLRDRQRGPRMASVACLTNDGQCQHILLQEAKTPAAPGKASVQLCQRERMRPAGSKSYGLFTIEGETPGDLKQGLHKLEETINSQRHAPADPRWYPIEAAARQWYRKNGRQPQASFAVGIVSRDLDQLKNQIQTALHQVTGSKASNTSSITSYYNFEPIGKIGKIAFVFPGSGNHFVGMGRAIGVTWPDILRQMDAETSQLKSQMLPHLYAPQRISWEKGWESDALRLIESNATYMLFGQVVFGSLMTRVMQQMKVTPEAVIGYSLGESTGLFAMGVWPDRQVMLERLLKSDLFTDQLWGACQAARKAWQVPEQEKVDWRVAVVNRSADKVKRLLSKFPTLRLLIVNTPGECVIGGRQKAVAAAVKQLGCDAVYLEGITTVHCDAVIPVQKAYRDLHLFDTKTKPGICFYSCADAVAYTPATDSAADSILNQAINGFDFPATIRQAYEDGCRIFLEMGPGASCTRMIDRILGLQPHRAISASIQGQDEILTILKAAAALIAERIPVDLEFLYGEKAFAPDNSSVDGSSTEPEITVPIGQKTSFGRLPPVATPKAVNGSGQTPVAHANSSRNRPVLTSPMAPLIESQSLINTTTAKAHQDFLEFADELQTAYGRSFAFQTRLLSEMAGDPRVQQIEVRNRADKSAPQALEAAANKTQTPVVAFSREMCMEFAVGSVAKVLGPEFSDVDSYPARVRLPDEPLMLVDRILTIDGEKGSLRSGKIVTEHDVLPSAWYLDGGKAPVCISVEAGQADLFLCAYLGIDLAVKGQRTYRLLDASVTFHRGLPQPGDVIRYEIGIDKFIRQGLTYLFFFHFEGYIGDTHLITMRNGCAGFFTEEEVRNSGGLILTADELQPEDGRREAGWCELAPIDQVEAYSEQSLDDLRRGRLEKCFGIPFTGVALAPNLRLPGLPGEPMRLFHRILHLDPAGGRYGLGIIRAEADIHPDDWFLTCHFVDDMVMPGTLMYECCAHTLRVLVQRLGWISQRTDVCYEPVAGREAVLKCRGPVTPATQHVIYEVFIKEIGYQPEPYVVADALMYADGHRIVSFKGMSMQMTGVTQAELESFWHHKQPQRDDTSPPKASPADRQPVFDRRRLLAFALGNPSDAFGEPYRPFDRDRFIARLPNPPYLLIDRIVRAEHAPWKLAPGGWIEAEIDITPEAWYFAANRCPSMPYSILLEIALQPCGWLAAYAGSALKSDHDLRFRNLGGTATQYQDVSAQVATLTSRARMTQVAAAGDMIIEHFEFEIRQDGQKVYAGTSYFGFFTLSALNEQVGLQEDANNLFTPTEDASRCGHTHRIGPLYPLYPEDIKRTPATALCMPGSALGMIDQIEVYLPAGGPDGLGYIKGIKQVNPKEWFFKAHFYQDPVWAGSLGVEAFLQLVRYAAIRRWKRLRTSHRLELATGLTHTWTYRGQVVPDNRQVAIEAAITQLSDTPQPQIMANGYLQVDGLYIYKMENFGYRLVPV